MNQAANPPRNGISNDYRYSKDELLNIYHIRKEAGLAGSNLHQNFIAPWDVSVSENGVSSRDGKDVGPEVCWNAQPRMEPFSLREMDESERQVCMNLAIR